MEGDGACRVAYPVSPGCLLSFQEDAGSEADTEYQTNVGQEQLGVVAPPPEFSIRSLAAYYLSLFRGGSVALGTEVLVRGLDLLTPERALAWVQRLIALKSAVFR